MGTVRLSQPYSGKVLEVAEESADSWRSLGYTDEAKPKSETEKAPEKKAPAKKTAAKKSEGK